MSHSTYATAPQAPSVRFGILGPVEISDGRGPLPPIAPRHRGVLAYLLLHARQAVSTDGLVEALWGGLEPETSRTQIQASISVIRRTLRGAQADGLLTTTPAGYVLAPARGSLDVDVFHGFVTEARAREATAPADAAVQLRAALDVWRGPALADVPAPFASSVRHLLDEERLTAFERLADLELGLGRHEDLTGELAALAETHPLRERLHAQLMRALCGCGRQPSALEVARRFRAGLADELGLDPSPAFDALESAVLRGDLAPPAITGQSARQAARTGFGHPGPAQLPFGTRDFVGRGTQLAQLNALLPDEEDPGQRPLGIAIVSGPGGVGKTSLALRWAHQVRDRFPDGQLYVDLHGHATIPALRAPDALGRFVRALGVPPEQVPAEAEEAAALYRTLVSDRRMLIVLDNAGSPEQVRPLLPGAAGSLVLVTSRDRLGGLVVRDGARRLDLDVLRRDEAVALLARVGGPERAASEPETATALAHACGDLPLALCIAAARLAARPHWSFGDLLGRLADERRRLDELSLGDDMVRASFTLSYRHLGPPEALLFRRLGLLATAEVAPWTAAAVLECDLSTAQGLLESLVDAQLLQTVRQGADGWTRYRFHDLIRCFADEQARQQEPAQDRHAAVRRALGCLLALAEEAHRRHMGGDFGVVHGTAERRHLARHETDTVLADPMTWLESERRALVCAVLQASDTDTGLDELAWDLAMTLITLFETRRYADDWLTTHERALDAARRQGNALGVATMTYGLGSLDYFWQRRGAIAHLSTALDLFTELGNGHGAALALRRLAHIDRLAGRFGPALERCAEARRLLEATGDRGTEAQVLADTVQVHLDLGDLTTAEVLFTDSLQLFHEVHNLRGQWQALHRLGELHFRQGDLAAAETQLGDALELVRQDGDALGEAYVGRAIGDVRMRQGRLAEAGTIMAEARQLAARLGDRFAEARACLSLGELAAAQGDQGGSVRLLEEAAALFERSHATVWQGRALDALADNRAARA